MKKVLGNIFRFLMIAISAVMLGCFVETMFSNMVNIGNIVGCAVLVDHLRLHKAAAPKDKRFTEKS